MNELRDLAPQVLGALVHRYGDFANAEDAVQEALMAAVTTWPDAGVPDDPRAWLFRVASRRMANIYRAEETRRRREEIAASWSIHDLSPRASTDDTLTLMLLCCHPALTPGTAVPLTLRAVGGLTTREIASAFLVAEATMAQRISRAKSKLKDIGDPFELPDETSLPGRTKSVLQVLYQMFNEGYTTSEGATLGRVDLSAEAIRLTRNLLASMSADPEVEGLMGLMLLCESRRLARTTADGSLIPLASQDRTVWDRQLITEGLEHATAALARPPAGPYALQAAINALHAEARSHESTRWADIATLYLRLEAITGNPVVRLNRAVAVAMVEGPNAGLEVIAELDGQLGKHHRLASVRAHLHEMAGDGPAAVEGFLLAASRTLNVPEQNYLLTQAARVRMGGRH